VFGSLDYEIDQLRPCAFLEPTQVLAGRY